MEESKLISVIVPIYNVEKQIDRCINSLLKQTYQNIEIIFVVDGSPDSCAAICDIYAIKDPRIKVIHKKNGGLSSARNAGIKTLLGNHLLFVDSDDSLDLNTIEFCLEATENGKYDIVGFGYHYYLEQGSINVFQSDTKRDALKIGLKNELHEKLLSLIKDGVFDFCTDKFYKASLITNNQLSFDGKFDGVTEDAVFMLETIPHISSIKIVSECFYNYFRRENESYTLSFKRSRFDRFYDRMVLEKFILDRLNINYDKSYFSSKYSTYFLWTYESLFSKTCNLSLIEKCKFVYYSFRKDELYDNFNAFWLDSILKGNPEGNYSKTSRKALLLVAKRKYALLVLWFCLTFLKNG